MPSAAPLKWLLRLFLEVFLEVFLKVFLDPCSLFFNGFPCARSKISQLCVSLVSKIFMKLDNCEVPLLKPK